MARSWLHLATVAVAVTILAGCAASSQTSPTQIATDESGFQTQAVQGAVSHAIPTPALIGVSQSGVLKYWPIKPRGGQDVQRIRRVPGLGSAFNMAANGNVLAIASGQLPGIILYNVQTRAEQRLNDPYGVPIDVAFDTKANLFVANFKPSGGNVTMFPAGASRPRELDCQYVQYEVAIAATMRATCSLPVPKIRFRG